MQLIKSNFLFENYYKKRTYIIDNFYYYIQNIIDIFDINNNMYDFIYNNFISSKKKCLFFYIIFNIEKISSTIINFIQFINKKNSITYDFFKLWSIKKKWTQVNIISVMPLSHSMEEYFLLFLKKNNEDKKYFIKKKINKNILGGIILCIEDREWDSSLKDCIRRLKIHLIK